MANWETQYADAGKKIKRKFFFVNATWNELCD